MSQNELCSAVFVLRPERMFPADQRFLGRMVHLLADFAFYSGLGGFTAQGMGMVRCHD